MTDCRYIHQSGNPVFRRNVSNGFFEKCVEVFFKRYSPNRFFCCSNASKGFLGEMRRRVFLGETRRRFFFKRNASKGFLEIYDEGFFVGKCDEVFFEKCVETRTFVFLGKITLVFSAYAYFEIKSSPIWF